MRTDKRGWKRYGRNLMGGNGIRPQSRKGAGRNITWLFWVVGWRGPQRDVASHRWTGRGAEPSSWSGRCTVGTLKRSARAIFSPERCRGIGNFIDFVVLLLRRSPSEHFLDARGGARSTMRWLTLINVTVAEHVPNHSITAWLIPCD